MSLRATRPTAYVLPIVAALVLVLLAGCLGSAPAEETDIDDDQGEDVIDKNDTNTSIDAWDPEAINPNSTFHTHDYWESEEKIVIADQVTIPGPNEEAWVTDSANALTPVRGGVIEFAVPIDENREKPRYVYPGTEKMEVELDWTGGDLTQTAAETSQQIGPVVRDQPAVLMCVNNEGVEPVSPCIQHFQQPDSPFQGINDSHAFSEPGTWVLEGDDMDGNDLFNPKTWDVPHTMKSKWRFAILAETCPPGTLQTRCLPAFDIDQFTVTVTIHRGEDLPLDPPHLDYYGDQETLTLLPESTLDGDDVPVDCSNEQAGGLDPRTTTLWFGEEYRDRKPPMCQLDGEMIRELYRDEVAEAPVVPPGTTIMRVQLDWDHSSLTDVQLHFGYRDAVTNWIDDWKFEYLTESCSGNSCTYDIAVNARNADSLYSFLSVWEWGVFLQSQGEDQPTAPANSLTVQASIEVATATSALSNGG